MALSRKEIDLIKGLFEKRNKNRDENLTNRAYYNGDVLTQNLRSSVPAQFSSIPQVLGWIRSGIDRLSERVVFDGYQSDKYQKELNNVVESNEMRIESNISVSDMLVYGYSYVMVTRGDKSRGEPEVLVNVESPIDCSANINLRTRRASEVAHFIVRNSGSFAGADATSIQGTLFTEEEVIPFEASHNLESIREVEGRYSHGLGRPPVTVKINNRESGKARGNSEISRDWKSITQSVMRTMLGMEVAREFYSYPQKYIIGAVEDQFIKQNGEKVNQLELLMNSVLTLSRSGSQGEYMPEVGQFQSNDPSSFISLLEFYRAQFSSASSVPLHSLGALTANPSSEGAMRANDSILIKKAEDKISMDKKAQREIAWLVLRTLGEEEVDVSDIDPIYLPPETATRSALADEALKLVSIGVFRPDSEVLYNRMGLTQREIAKLKKENQAAKADAVFQAMNAARVNPSGSSGIYSGATEPTGSVSSEVNPYSSNGSVKEEKWENQS